MYGGIVGTVGISWRCRICRQFSRKQRDRDRGRIWGIFLLHIGDGRQDRWDLREIRPSKKERISNGIILLCGWLFSCIRQCDWRRFYCGLPDPAMWRELLANNGTTKALILADSEKSFITVNVLCNIQTSTFDVSDEMLEKMADSIDFLMISWRSLYDINCII